MQGNMILSFQLDTHGGSREEIWGIYLPITPYLRTDPVLFPLLTLLPFAFT